MKLTMGLPRYAKVTWLIPALLSGCAIWNAETMEPGMIGVLSWHSETQRLLVGRLEASGENVWLNGKPVSSGTEIYSGDEVSTGPASKAYVYFSSGGFIHIDENTDPLFNWLKTGACVLCKVGQVFIDAEQVCIETPHLAADAASQINLKITQDATTLTVVEGKVRLKGSRPRLVHSNEQLTVSRSGGAAKVRRLSNHERLSAIEWHSAVIAVSSTAGQPVASVAKVEPPPRPAETVRFEDVFFGFDDDTIRSDQVSQLEKVADVLRNHPTLRILIEGYSDPRGSVKYNKALGFRRAQAVQDFLVNRGIAPRRIETISRGGESHPAVCADEACWAQNRRARFSIIAK